KLLALAALGSMVGWPLYRMGKSYTQRGRLPDMKSNRVTITSIIAFLIVLAFFLLPLPVSRVSDKGLVELQPERSQKVFIPYSKGATLQRIAVEEGDRVERGQLLAVFTSDELDEMKAKYATEKKIQHDLAESYRQALSKARAEEVSKLQPLIEDALEKERNAIKIEAQVQEIIENL